MSNSKYTNDIQREIKRRKQEIYELEQKAKQERFSLVNKRLREWQSKIMSTERYNSLSDGATLSIYPHMYAGTSLLDFGRGTIELSNKDNLWDFQTYIHNDGACKPATFRRKTLDELQPPGGVQDIILFTKYGIRFKLESDSTMKDIKRKIDDLDSWLRNFQRNVANNGVYMSTQDANMKMCFLDQRFDFLNDEDYGWEDQEIVDNIFPQSLSPDNIEKIVHTIEDLKQALQQK